MIVLLNLIDNTSKTLIDIFNFNNFAIYYIYNIFKYHDHHYFPTRYYSDLIMRSFNNQAQPKSNLLLNLMYNPNNHFIKFDGLQRLVVILNSNNYVIV